MYTMLTNPTRRWYSYLLLMLALPFKSFAAKPEDIFEQPTEDTVKANATFFITPRDIKYNRNQYKPIEISLTKMDRFMVVEQHNYLLQNLGNNWTATQYIPYRLPQRIGATDGIAVYDFNFHQPQDIRYYCMPKSKAYTYFNVVLANIGSFVFDGCYSQRLLDNWFAGINLYGAMTENEWPQMHKEDKKIVDAFPQFDIFTHFHLLDSAYYACTSYSIMNYRTKETGGVLLNKKEESYPADPLNCYRYFRKLLDEKGIQARIPLDDKGQVQHNDRRRHFYFFHQYHFNTGIQCYHEFSYSCKNNKSNIACKEKNARFIAPIAKSKENHLPAIESKVLLNVRHNEIGVKGRIASIDVDYNVHARLENIHFEQYFSKTLENTTTPFLLADVGKKNKGNKEDEFYLGGHLQWDLTQRMRHQFQLEGEYGWAGAGYYTLMLAYQNRFFKLVCDTLKHKVPYLVQYGYFPYRHWPKTYKAPATQQLAAAFTYKLLPWVRVEPMVTLQRMHNLIYYKEWIGDNEIKKDSDVHCISVPSQVTDPIDLCSYGGHLDVSFSYFHIDNTLFFLEDISNLKPKIYKGRMPWYSYTGRYYFAHQPYEKKMAIEIGINVHKKALHYADSYDIIAQRFYKQQRFAVQGRPIVDFFVNYRLSNIKISIKFSCINDYFGDEKEGKGKSYFATPFYPGQKPAADIGVHWSFFD
ncbi:MAG: putative porin [Candidatus Cardinium sp.]|nr:putative porin [Candidatus Cardinium sp.]